MIRVTRLNGKEFVLNADLIECIEASPDTVIKLNNGRKYVVLESVDEVLEKIEMYQRASHAPLSERHASDTPSTWSETENT